MPRNRRRADTSVSLHPHSFDEAVEALARAEPVRREDLRAEESGNTSEPAPPESVLPKRRSGPRR